MDENKKPSIQDIADAADVSIATVSRVLNKSNKVRKDTANRVMKIAEKMNYRPDRVARRMRVKSSESLIIGLIVTDIGNPFFSELSRGVEDIAYENKHATMISNTDENTEKEKFYIDSMLSEKVSGLIIAPTSGNTEYLNKLRAENYPVVCVDRYPDSIDIDTVTTSNEKGAYDAVKRFTSLGHERIAIVNGIRGLSTTEERFRGYKRAMEEAGLPILEDYITYEDYKESGGRKAIRELMTLDKPPTAIFSTNNLMTLGCYEELHRRQIGIPSEVAIIGFDDMPWSTALNPPLTAVKQPGYELGVNAAELLIKRLQSPDRNTMNMVLNPELIIRESCNGPI